MAASAKHLSFLFLLVLFFSSLQVQARESKFFSKVTHYSGNKNVPESTAPYIEAPAPEPEPPKSQNGYGLYGHETTQFTPTKTTTTAAATTTTTTNDGNEMRTEELNNESYKEVEMSEVPVPYNNNGYSNNNNNNGYSNNNNNNGYYYNNNNNGYYSNNNGYSNNNNGYSNNNNNGYSNNNDNNNGYPNNYNNNAYVTEKQGMSDTRFLENGKYSYDGNNENYYPNGYESAKESSKNEGHYGNNEFNSMEEYQQSQEGYIP